MPRYASPSHTSSHVLWLGSTIHPCIYMPLCMRIFMYMSLSLSLLVSEFRWLYVVSSPLNSVLCCEHLRYVYFLAPIMRRELKKRLWYKHTHTHTRTHTHRNQPESINSRRKWRKQRDYRWRRMSNRFELAFAPALQLITNTWNILHTRIDTRVAVLLLSHERKRTLFACDQNNSWFYSSPAMLSLFLASAQLL